VVLASGVTCALSESAAAAVVAAAAQAPRFVYDLNFRPRLTDAATAAARLRELAPHADLVTPSVDEAAALLGFTDPGEIAQACRNMGARAAAVTRGAEGVWLDDGVSVAHLPAVPPPVIVDQTGAGDAFAGTIAARLALGDVLLEAVRRGMAAASAVLAVQGGCAR
jgi:2-dehydro-3-deoxygluconokinase